jgi:signal-transduction protein with cAMP-binding, CBS, and nucleotidyltransferase domain
MSELKKLIDTASLDKALRVPRGSTLREVAATMEDAKTSCLLVGISTTWLVTDHDLAGALAAGLDSEASVERIAVKSPVWATESTELLDAVNMMIHHHIRHLLVLAATGEPLGVLSLATATRLLLDMNGPRNSDGAQSADAGQMVELGLQ